MRRLTVLTLLSLLFAAAGLGQARGPMRVPVGTRVKVGSPTVEGTVLSWGDSVVVRVEKPGGLADTVRLATASLTGVRVLESPLQWRYATTSDVTFYTDVAVPRLHGDDSTSVDDFRHVIVVASKDQFAGVDAVTGAALWTRPDLANLSEVALDIVGNTGFGVIMRGDTLESIDLRTGKTRWNTAALSLSASGWLPLPGEDTLVLLSGRTTQSASTLLTVELGTGTVRWRQHGLFTVPPKVFGTKGVSYLLGHQDPLGDTDSTIVLYLSTEGPIRLDARTGSLLWRADLLRDAKIPARRDGYARMRYRDGVLFVPSEKRLVALNATDGRLTWPAPRSFKNQVVRMAWARQ